MVRRVASSNLGTFAETVHAASEKTADGGSMNPLVSGGGADGGGAASSGGGGGGGEDQMEWSHDAMLSKVHLDIAVVQNFTECVN